MPAIHPCSPLYAPVSCTEGSSIGAAGGVGGAAAAGADSAPSFAGCWLLLPPLLLGGGLAAAAEDVATTTLWPGGLPRRGCWRSRGTSRCLLAACLQPRPLLLLGPRRRAVAHIFEHR